MKLLLSCWKLRKILVKLLHYYKLILAYVNNYVTTITNQDLNGGLSFISKTKNARTTYESGKRIEDKLLEYGENLKNKKTNLIIEKQMEEDKKLDFKPPKAKTSSSKVVNLDLSKYGGDKFLDRMTYTKTAQKEKLEVLRSKYKNQKDVRKF